MVQWLRICLLMQGHGFNPWSRKIPCAMGQLNPCATTTKPTGPRACALQKKKPPQWEAHALQLESSLHSWQLEKVHTEECRPSAVKKIMFFFFKVAKVKDWSEGKKSTCHLLKPMKGSPLNYKFEFQPPETSGWRIQILMVDEDLLPPSFFKSQTKSCSDQNRKEVS